jgi:cation-transporting ATPase E
MAKLCRFSGRQSLLRSPTTRNETRWSGRLVASYTRVALGSTGYTNTVATVLAQGSLSMFISWIACLLILFIEPPSRFFLGWRSEVSPDKRPAWLALGLFVLFLIIWSVEPSGYCFGILVKPIPVQAIILSLVLVWFFIMRTIWRFHLFERFLGLYKA